MIVRIVFPMLYRYNASFGNRYKLEMLKLRRLCFLLLLHLIKPEKRAIDFKLCHSTK